MSFSTDGATHPPPSPSHSLPVQYLLCQFGSGCSQSCFNRGDPRTLPNGTVLFGERGDDAG
ncbi:UNVERIFIED_CONTAM: hypothetical protein FKN15_051831 [Acipenser sinensis]